MTGKPVPPPGEPRDARPRPAPARPDDPAEALKRLRDALLRRLESIEALAAEQAELLDRDGSDRERLLRERIAVLEASQARLQAESRRREQEWQDALRDLEADRKLLAEAWERLEQLQTRYEPRTHVDAPAPTVPPPPVVTPTPLPEPTPGDDGDDPVTRAILRQFQVLSNDVRRNAKGKGGR